MNLSKKIEDKRKAKQRAEKVKKAKIATAGVVLGAVTGAVSGVLWLLNLEKKQERI